MAVYQVPPSPSSLPPSFPPQLKWKKGSSFVSNPESLETLHLDAFRSSPREIGETRARKQEEREDEIFSLPPELIYTSLFIEWLARPVPVRKGASAYLLLQAPYISMSSKTRVFPTKDLNEGKRKSMAQRGTNKSMQGLSLSPFMHVLRAFVFGSASLFLLLHPRLTPPSTFNSDFTLSQSAPPRIS